MPTGNVHFCRSSVNIDDFEQVFGKRLNYSKTVQFVQQVMKKGNHWFYGNVSFSKTFKNLLFPEKVVLFYSGLNFLDGNCVLLTSALWKLKMERLLWLLCNSLFLIFQFFFEWNYCKFISLKVFREFRVIISF